MTLYLIQIKFNILIFYNKIYIYLIFLEFFILQVDSLYQCFIYYLILNFINII